MCDFFDKQCGWVGCDKANVYMYLFTLCRWVLERQGLAASQSLNGYM